MLQVYTSQKQNAIRYSLFLFQSCNTGNKESSSRPRSGDSMAASAMTTEDSLLVEAETTMWVCLQCGHQVYFFFILLRGEVWVYTTSLAHPLFI